MKKSSFAALILGTVSGILFALGMCMALIVQWDTFLPGVVLGCAGLLMGLITVLVWRRMEHKDPIRLSGKAAGVAVLGVAGALALGVGMCFSMVWSQMALGILIGLFGIAALLSLIPLVKGLR